MVNRPTELTLKDIMEQMDIGLDDEESDDDDVLNEAALEEGPARFRFG